jgi:hypothetical protein
VIKILKEFIDLMSKPLKGALVCEYYIEQTKGIDLENAKK